ncbi:MAG: DNA-binding protein [Xenococcus sp. (in: cyanobacteria)]
MDKIVGTTEAAFLLNISVSRVKVLLQQERIKGARKEGRVWKIPLIKGIPQVKECKHGLKGTWRRRRCNKMTQIHVIDILPSRDARDSSQPNKSCKEGSFLS